jgi:predicted transglutaminase-like cysteine proteinase
MRQTAKSLAVAAMIAATCWTSNSQAAFFSFPRMLRIELDRIAFEEPTLAPMAHTMFCLRYAQDCEVHEHDFRRRNIAMTVERLNELNSVNLEVNRNIAPQPNLGGLATEQWILSPPAGDCNDYAVTKRHELLARGWPSRALLLSEVVVPSGEHHLVLVVRMKDPESTQNVDLVLDNLSANLRPVGRTPYQWVRVESPVNPKYWSKVSVLSNLHTAMAIVRTSAKEVASKEVNSIEVGSKEMAPVLAENALARRVHARQLLLNRAALTLGVRQS